MRENPPLDNCGNVLVPLNLQSALEKLSQEPPAWKILAGGTDLMVRQKRVAFDESSLEQKWIHLWGLKELRFLKESPEGLTIGSLTTFSDLIQNPVIDKEFPVLGEAAATVGATAIQNRATVGGNIMNGSPAADSPPALLIYEASVELTSVKGSRWIPYHLFHTGYKKTVCEPSEILTAIRLPKKFRTCQHYFRKVAPRQAHAISKVTFAGTLQRGDQQPIQEVRIGLGSVAPTPLRATQTENYLKGQKKITSQEIQEAQQILGQEITPMDDLRSTAAYRKQVAQNLLREFLEFSCGIG